MALLSNRCILIFGEDWGRFPSTTQHIGRELLTQNRVMWVGSLAHRKPTLSIADLKRVYGKLRNLFHKQAPVATQEATPILVHPFIFPFHDSALFRRLNAVLLRKQLVKAMAHHGFSNPVLITSSPMAAGVVGTLGESSSHYFCLDDYSHFEGAFRDILKIERELLNRVTAAYSVSDSLVAARTPATGRSYFLPQGVNVAHFKKHSVLPQRVAAIPKPVAGFFGLVSSWIDLHLIVFLAKKNPGVSFVVLGRASVDTTPFAECPNIYFLGEIPFAELPAYASCFDVGLISFVVNELTIACNPLKLLEYLSLGIPVVSTNLPEVAKFGTAVHIARDYEEFNQMLLRALADNSKEARQQRLALAEQFSWRNITEDICGRILAAENKS